MSDARQTLGETLVYESRLPEGKNFELFVPDAPTTAHVDGIAGIGLVGPFGRIEFFVTESAKPDPDPALGVRERRVIRLRVAMPAPQLIEGLLNLLGQVKLQAENLRVGIQAQDQLMAKQIERLKAVQIEEPPHE